MAIYGSLTGSPPYWHPLLLSAHLQGDYLSVVLPKWKCGVPEGRWNVPLGNWVVRGNVSYFKADDRPSWEMARRAKLVYGAKDSLSN